MAKNFAQLRAGLSAQAQAQEKAQTLLAEMPLNEIVEEIHHVRQQHTALFNDDLDQIIDDLRLGQKQHVAEGWVLIKRTMLPVGAPHLALQRTRFACH
jgi:hypothetical protein